MAQDCREMQVYVKKKRVPGMAVHACSPSYSGGRRILGSGPELGQGSCREEGGCSALGEGESGAGGVVRWGGSAREQRRTTEIVRELTLPSTGTTAQLAGDDGQPSLLPHPAAHCYSARVSAGTSASRHAQNVHGVLQGFYSSRVKNSRSMHSALKITEVMS
jgi:hypothetical protein